jgi:pyruvate/2-oxoglutarate dehydrogenase complex dihydrolipoamide acyltransferase (E2) component
MVPTLSVWYARPGERVFEGDRVVELLLEGATFDVASPCTGRVVENLLVVGEAAPPGRVLGYIEEQTPSTDP